MFSWWKIGVPASLSSLHDSNLQVCECRPKPPPHPLTYPQLLCPTLAELDFPNYENRLNDQKGKGNKIRSMIKCEENLNGHRTAFNASCNEVKYNMWSFPSNKQKKKKKRRRSESRSHGDFSYDSNVVCGAAYPSHHYPITGLSGTRFLKMSDEWS